MKVNTPNKEVQGIDPEDVVVKTPEITGGFGLAMVCRCLQDCRSSMRFLLDGNLANVAL